MPVTKVKSPTGEIIKVQHPDGASQAEIIEFAKANQKPAPQAIPEPMQANMMGFAGDVLGKTADYASLVKQQGMDFPKSTMGFLAEDVQQVPALLQRSGATDFLPDIAATAASMAFPPMAEARALQMLSKVTPGTMGRIYEIMTPGAIGALVTGTTKAVAKNAIRFSPSIAASGVGGFTGSIAEDLVERDALRKLGQVPPQDEFDAIFEKATKEGGKQMMFEVAGIPIFRGFEMLFAPNAWKLARQNKQFIKFVQENDLPVLPGAANDDPGVWEGILEAFGFGGRVIKGRAEAMAKIIEYNPEDTASFINKTLQLEQRPLEEIAVNKLTTNIRDVLMQSVTPIPRQGLGNQMKPGLNGVIIDGQKLTDNLNAARDRLVELGASKQQMEALENLAVYAKGVKNHVYNYANNAPMITEYFRQAPGPITSLVTGGLLLSLYTGKEGIDLFPGALEGGATTPELLGASILIPTMTWFADSISHGKGGLFKFFTEGAISSSHARELVRQATNLAMRTTTRSYTGPAGNEPSLFPSDLGFNPFDQLPGLGVKDIPE
jgi:hypothetical protein